MHKKFLFLITLPFVFVAASCSKDEPSEYQKEQEAIRGYWLCESQDLALEIISEREYEEMKGLDHTSDSYDNVYQLWGVGGDSPLVFVPWTTVTDFYFHNPEYTWRDRAYISYVDDETLSLNGVDYYHFDRVSKEYFDDLVHRSGGSSGGGNSGSGDDDNHGGSGGNSGGSEVVDDFYETNFTSTEYTNKIKVEFYFSDKVSSATIKYGTSSSCPSSKTATVISKSASATITGLKPGTTYYFKCVAKSKSGQTCTTEAYPVMTNFD